MDLTTHSFKFNLLEVRLNPLTNKGELNGAFPISEKSECFQ